jgi:hypothetical protein
MANAIYPLYKKAAMTTGAGNLLTADVKVALIDTGTYSYAATDEFMSDVASGAIIAISPTLTTPAVSDVGAFDSDDPVFAAVTGNQSEALILFIDNGGDDATSRLIAYQDTGVTGLPITPNGGDITVTVDAAGWFTL